jgi:GNAT superfamily N-acetyltransferase
MMSAEEIRIRPARPDDVPVIVGFIRALAEYERLLDQCVAREETLREHLFGENPYCEVLIAEDASGPAGFALYFFNYSTFLTAPGIYLEDLFVLPERRGAGVGRALLTRLAQVALERGCGRLEWSVLDWNEPAIGFYRRLGARLMDEWTGCRLSGEALLALAGAESRSGAGTERAP